MNMIPLYIHSGKIWKAKVKRSAIFATVSAHGPGSRFEASFFFFSFWCGSQSICVERISEAGKEEGEF